MRHIDFENIEDKFDKALESKEWKKLEKDFAKSSDIYIVANGGLWAVGNHAADDCARLFAKAGIEKAISSLDSQCLITSLANDYGWNNLFVGWLELQKKTGKMKDEIENLNNGQDLPVWDSRGGWWNKDGANLPFCRHQWVQMVVKRK